MIIDKKYYILPLVDGTPTSQALEGMMFLDSSDDKLYISAGDGNYYGVSLTNKVQNKIYAPTGTIDLSGASSYEYGLEYDGSGVIQSDGEADTLEEAL